MQHEFVFVGVLRTPTNTKTLYPYPQAVQLQRCVILSIEGALLKINARAEAAGGALRSCDLRALRQDFSISALDLYRIFAPTDIAWAVELHNFFTSRGYQAQVEIGRRFFRTKRANARGAGITKHLCQRHPHSRFGSG